MISVVYLVLIMLCKMAALQSLGSFLNSVGRDNESSIFIHARAPCSGDGA